MCLRMIDMELGPIRPPSEAESLMLRVTRGCHWNKCYFCDLYKKYKFSRRRYEEIEEDLKKAADSEYAQNYTTCFLQDPYLDTPYLVFGHSLGAKISYEVCNELREKQDNAPCHLIVSGSRAPHIPEPEPLHHLQDVDFIEAMKRYSGMSKEFLENRDLLNLFLPIFRADFILDETYCFTKYEKFDFPITALYGDQDQDSEIDTVEAWSEYTNTSFNKKVFHGEHFFIKTSEKEVLAYIKDIVSRYV